jgi:hypothetical protein
MDVSYSRVRISIFGRDTDSSYATTTSLHILEFTAERATGNPYEQTMPLSQYPQATAIANDLPTRFLA